MNEFSDGPNILFPAVSAGAGGRRTRLSRHPPPLAAGGFWLQVGEHFVVLEAAHVGLGSPIGADNLAHCSQRSTTSHRHNTRQVVGFVAAGAAQHAVIGLADIIGVAVILADDAGSFAHVADPSAARNRPTMPPQRSSRRQPSRSGAWHAGCGGDGDEDSLGYLRQHVSEQAGGREVVVHVFLAHRVQTTHGDAVLPCRERIS